MFCSKRWVAKLCRSVCRRHALVDLGHLGCGMAGAVELACRERVAPVPPGKQPALWPRRLPPGAQQFEQMRREHHVAVLAALALLDADHHALAVDVGHLQRDHLGDAQARAIGHAQRRLVLEPGRRLQQARHLLRAQDHRQLARLAHKRVWFTMSASPERHREEEPQRRDRVVDGWHADAARRPDAAGSGARPRSSPCPGERPRNDREVLDAADVVMLRLRRELADRHVFDHAPAQRADRLVGHGDAPVLSEVAEPLIFRQDAPSALSSSPAAACRSALPRERFSPLARRRPASHAEQSLLLGGGAEKICSL